MFEHVRGVQQLIATLSSLLVSDGIILFSTPVSNGQIRHDKPLDWAYASPRNGHISLFSTQNLARLGAKESFSFASVNSNLHAFWRNFPDCAKRPSPVRRLLEVPSNAMKAPTESLLRAAELHLQRGDVSQAEQLAREIIAIEGDHAAGLNLLARAITGPDRLSEAITNARAAIGADPTNARFLVTLGELLIRAGHHADAIVTLQSAIGLAPEMAQAQFQLGEAYASSQCPASAEDAYCAAIGLWGSYPDAHRALGRLLLREGRHQEAVAILDRAIALDPTCLDAYTTLAGSYISLGNIDGAIHAYTRLTEALPGSPLAWHKLGQVSLAHGRHKGARAALRRGLELEPNHIGCLMGLAESLIQTQRPADAATPLRRVVARVPDHLEAIQLLARVLLGIGNLREAEQFARRASELAPRDPNVQYALGNVLLRRQRPEDALACYRYARKLGANTPKARFAEAAPLLMMGKLSDGWAAHEARLGMRGVPWKIANPLDKLWDGRTLADETLLVHTEQGIGDTLQFVRYLPLLRGHVGPGARITLLCEPELARLVRTVGGFDELVTQDAGGSLTYDLQVPLLTLPHLLNTTLETIPHNVPYIRLPTGVGVPLPQSSTAKLKIAFAWAGRPTHSDDRMRSCAVDLFATLFEIPGTCFYSIQVGSRAPDIAPYLNTDNVYSMSAQLTDLARTLSVIDQVDLLISVDTSVAHLGGAYGKPVWTLLAHGAEWRWLINREDSPWYPSMRLFRQHTAGDWATLFGELRGKLEDLLREKGGTP